MSPSDLQAFDSAWWASWPLEIQALQPLSQADRAEPVTELITQGQLIDNAIMVWGWDAYLTMQLRWAQGQTWTPSALQLPLGDPNGVALPGMAPVGNQTAYNPAAPYPAGSIPVPNMTLPIAQLVALYSSFNPPAPLASAPSQPADPVGQVWLGSMYYDLAGDQLPAGARYTDARGSFVKVVVQTPFGNTQYWQKIA